MNSLKNKKGELSIVVMGAVFFGMMYLTGWLFPCNELPEGHGIYEQVCWNETFDSDGPLGGNPFDNNKFGDMKIEY